MESWEVDYEWLRIRHFIKDRFKKEELPDLDAVLFLIGVQELGRWKKSFTKEEKQDLMHIAVCRLLSEEGYYEFAGRDQDGWPHYRQIRTVPVKGDQAQEELLLRHVIKYFKTLEAEQQGF